MVIWIIFKQTSVNTDVDLLERFDEEARFGRLYKQMNIFDDFVSFWVHDDKYSALSKHHGKYKYNRRQCKWSVVERFRYLSILYDMKPEAFPNLSGDQLEEMRNKFYENQAFIATLPVI